MKNKMPLEPSALAFASQQLHHMMQEAPEHQFSLTKNYLWLAVVFLTAQTKVYEEQIHSLIFTSVSNILFSLSLFCSLSVLIIGIVLLSGMWFKRPIMPFNKMQDITSFLQQCYEANCDVNYQNNGLLSNIDESLNSHDRLLRKRALFLKAQCLLSLGAVIFGVISYFML